MLLFKKKKYFMLIAAMILPVIMAFSALFSPSNASNNLTIVREGGVVTYLSDLSCDEITSVDDALDELNSLSHVYGFTNVYDELRLNKIMENIGGYVFAFDQYFNGLYVYPRGIKMSVTKDLNVELLAGNYLSNITPYNMPILLEDDAITAAKQYDCSAQGHVHADGYCINDTSNILSYSLVIYAPTNDFAAYAYRLSTSTCDIFIDAQTGKALDVIYSAGASGTVAVESVAVTAEDRPILPAAGATTKPYYSTQTDYYNNQIPLTVSVSLDNSVYSLVDGFRNISVAYSNNINNETGTVFSSSNGVFSNKIAVTALDNFTKIFDFYTDENNIGVSVKGINNTVKTDIFGEATQNGEKQIKLVILQNVGYDNAYCAADYPNKNYSTLVFGDYIKYAVAMEVCAHEYQHAVTNYLSQLVYLNQSGALDEAISDMFGSLLKGIPLSDPNFWLVGDGIPGNNIMRSAIEPAKYGGPTNVSNKTRFCNRAGDHYYHGCDNGGVHTNSMIITHAFYNMYLYSERYALKVFDNSNIGKLLYTGLQKLTPNIDWTTYANVLISSADMIGLTTSEADQLKRCLEYGFGYVGILGTVQDNRSSISFNITDGYAGTAPQTITGYSGETFVIPKAEITRPGYDFLGWSEYPNSFDFENIFVPGVEYTIPAHNLVLYPAARPIAWNDVQLTSWYGEGTKSNPYRISSAADLATLALRVNVPGYYAVNQPIADRYFVLTADIDLLASPWIPIGMTDETSINLFFDGGSHSISNLAVVGNDLPYAGLFGNVSGEIKNLTLKTVDIAASATSVGGIAGTFRGSFKNCMVEGGAIINDQVYGYAGGIAGMLGENSSVINCINAASVTADFAGGITAKNVFSLSGRATISACINTGKITADEVAGGIVALSVDTIFINCINAGEIKLTNATAGAGAAGGIAGLTNYYFENGARMFSAFLSCKSFAKITFEESQNDYFGLLIGQIGQNNGELVFENNIVMAQSGVNTIGADASANQHMLADITVSTDLPFCGDFDLSLAAYYNKDNWAVANGLSNIDFITGYMLGNDGLVFCMDEAFWDQATATAFDGGTGSKTNPYKIATAAQLALLLNNVNNDITDTDGKLFAEKHYIQTADIDASGKLWTGIGHFNTDASGKLVLKNATAFSGSYDGQEYYIDNLVALERSTGTASAASLFGALSGTVKNIRLHNYSALGSSGAAGIAYAVYNNAVITNCVVDGLITASAAGGAAAGIACFSYLSKTQAVTISECASYSKISASVAAGILGTTIFNDAAGSGSAGLANINLIACANVGNITDYTSVTAGFLAGIAANISEKVMVTDCVNIGNISAYNYVFGAKIYMGGIVSIASGSENNMVIEGCKQAGSLISPYVDSVFSVLSARAVSSVTATINKTGYLNDLPIAPQGDLISINNSEKDDRDIFKFDSLDYLSGSSDFIGNNYLNLYVILNYEYGYNDVFFFDGNNNLINTQRIVRGSDAVAPVIDDTREGNVVAKFIGWSCEIINVTKTSYVYPIFSQTEMYTVRFISDGTQLEASELEKGTSVNMLAPEKDGYVFAGWYSDQALTQKISSLNLNADTVLYAKWTAESDSSQKSGCGSVADSSFTLYAGIASMLLFAAFVLVVLMRKASGKNPV